MGIGHPGIAGHHQYISSLTGFRQYLLNEHLAYEMPPSSADAHPDLIWKLLASDEANRRPGLVLHGPGGVGKTRLCLEVAARAHTHGWRVLHVSPTEESLTDRELTSVIVADTRPTLLCLDYIDLMQRIDYLAWGVRLVNEAASRGVRLRYLANSRPIWARTAMREGVALEAFSFLELRLAEDQNERILQRMMHSVAPKALEKWGQQELRRVCGQRPIIALLIAREIEDRLNKGSLERDELAAVAGGDLTAWLRKRLAQDELKVTQSSSVWVASSPSDAMIGACGALVMAPNNRQVVVDATATVLKSLKSSTDPSFIVSRLIEMGWLEFHGSSVATPHDVVTDELLDQIARDVDDIRSGPLGAVLSLWTCEPSAIGRLASALQRWIGGIPPGHPSIEKAEAISARWLRLHAGQIGELLATRDSDRSGFALGAILRWPPWSTTAADVWDDLLSPWLAMNGQLPEARHVLYLGLREKSLAQRLMASALIWLETCYSQLDASYVLAPLLERSDLQEKQPEQAIGHALAWLAKFPLEEVAEFVFSRLLERSDLQEKQAEEAIGYALAWLAKFPLEKDAQFVLAPLLGRSDLQEKQLEQAIGHALTWLAKFPLEIEARFVLHPLLERSDLQDKQSEQAIGYALAWLAKFPLEIDAQFVLHPLLERSDLQEKQLEQAIGHALAWLVKFPLEIEAEFVLHPLLGTC